MKKKYFVESVKNLPSGVFAMLLYIPEDIERWERDKRDFRWYVRREIDVQRDESVREGYYVYDTGDGYVSANDDPRSVRIATRYNSMLDVVGKNMKNRVEFSYQNISALYSYHVNVGHGNHSLIVFNANDSIHVWMIDCSDYDFVSHRYYHENIDMCLNHIRQKFHLGKSIHIDVVMLTHPHYDHYSGIDYYIDNKYIDRDSIIYLNPRYPVATGHNFTNLLLRLSDMGSPVIEPFADNSTQNIRILYPDRNSFNRGLSLNNLSSVYNIRFDDKSYFVFPGDLERGGWNLMSPCVCYPYLKNTPFYAISHHGSINGHLRDCICMRKITTLADCLSPYAVPVLMGRDRAFSGIYAPKVLADFNGRILYSEKDSLLNSASFLEIDLIAATPKWY